MDYIDFTDYGAEECTNCGFESAETEETKYGPTCKECIQNSIFLQDEVIYYENIS